MSDNPAPAPAAAAVDPNTKVRLFCKKHGEITDATLNLTFQAKEGKTGQYLYCLHCLNDVLLSLQKAGTLETVQIYVPEPTDGAADPNGAPPAPPPPPTAADLINALAAGTAPAAAPAAE